MTNKDQYWVLYKVYPKDRFSYASAYLAEAGRCVDSVAEYEVIKCDSVATECNRRNMICERETKSDNHPYGMRLWKMCKKEDFDEWQNYVALKEQALFKEDYIDGQ